MRPCYPRPRNAEATRTDILNTARKRFARDGYDEVGLREIAREVGVDAALISRYFGSKEDLFLEVMQSCDNGEGFMLGDRATWGQRVANQVMTVPKPESKMDGLLIMLRSLGSAKAMEIIGRSSDERFFRPLIEWMGGQDAEVRARLAASVVMGVAMGKEITGGLPLDDDAKARFTNRFARLLQSLLDDEDC